MKQIDDQKDKIKNFNLETLACINTELKSRINEVNRSHAKLQILSEKAFEIEDIIESEKSNSSIISSLFHQYYEKKEKVAVGHVLIKLVE